MQCLFKTCRVLIFLEALALGREPPAFGVHLLPQLLAAAQHLGLRDLEVRWGSRAGLLCSNSCCGAGVAGWPQPSSARFRLRKPSCASHPACLVGSQTTKSLAAPLARGMSTARSGWASLGTRNSQRNRVSSSLPLALQEYCQERLGDSTARLREYRFEEIRQLNAAGGCWLILDGMVLDVTRWVGLNRVVWCHGPAIQCLDPIE